MFFTISKILGYLLNPLGWIFLCLVIAVFLRNPKKKRRWVVIAFVILLIFTNPFIGDEALRIWERPLRSSSSIVKNHTAGVLLCGDIASYDKANDRIIFRTGSDRLLQTIDLYNRQKISKIIVSGGSGHLLYKDRTEATFIKKYLVGIGIPTDDIIFESRSRNTYENAKFTKELLDENSINNEIILITSSLHMKRASATFKKQGIQLIEYPTSKMVGERIKNFDHILIPSITTLHNWNLLIHEWLGYISYKISGYC